MQLKSETIFNIYTHKNRKILCRIKVPPQQQSRELKNTCRTLTPHQWNTFDRELEHLIDIQNKNDGEWDEEIFGQFNVKPNIEVKIQKSKLSTTNFYNCLEGDKVADDGDIDEVNVGGSGVADGSDVIVEQIKEVVLECLLDYREQTPSYVSRVKLLEYDPQVENSPDGPASYEPYTPSKSKYRLDSRDTVKTPGTDFLGYDSNEETYSPRPLTLSSTGGTTISETSANTIPEYKPAPITEKRSSKDSVKSRETTNEIVYETDDEQPVPTLNFRPLRSRITKKSKEIEYIPKSQEIVEAPAYVPTPIDEIKQNKKEKEKKLSPKEDTKKDKENNRNDKNLKIREEKPSASLVSTKQHQTSRKSQKEVKEKVVKKLDYKEKSKTKSEDKNEEIAKNILLKPTTPTSSDDDLDLFCMDAKSHIENYNEKLEELKTKKLYTEKGGDDLNITISSATESATDSSPPKKRTKEVHKKLSDNDTAKLRRSGRSPSKPRRLIEESTKLDIEKKSKPLKISPRHKELFGTDYEDDDFEKNTKGDNNNNGATTSTAIATKPKAVIFNTPKNENRHKPGHSSSSSSTKKKRKRDISTDCEQEKRTIGTWLSKKKSNSDLGPATTATTKEKAKSSKSSKSSSSSRTTNKTKSSKDNKNRRSRSESPSPPAPEDFVMPTKEELEKMRLTTKLQQENNEKIKAELEKIIVPPPKEVENLSLKDMSVSDLLATFDEHKHILDDIYQRNRKKDHIKSHDGINHCFVIRLMENQTQLKMLQKLTDVYSSANSTTQATLYANAMLPEWIIRVYMDKYSFSREEAMQQIKAQDDYQLHIDEQNESAFTFD